MWYRRNYFVNRLRNPLPTPTPTNVPPPIALAVQLPVSIEERAQAEARNVEAYFSRNRRHFEYERYLSNGCTGVSCKIRLRSDSGRRRSQYFVVKRPIRPGDDRGMKAEVDLLKLFRGSQHFVQLFYFPTDVFNPMENAPGTTIIVEWIENGTLVNLIQRKRDYQLPNRMLLEFFFCLVSFCIGMAWPSRGDRGAPIRQERIPDNANDREQMEQIAHNDMHCANVMIGDLDPAGDRHVLIPILKLIDFDLAAVVRCEPGENRGVFRNIYAIGMVMRSLIAGEILQIPDSSQMVTIKVGENLPAKTLSTDGSDITSEQYINLDEEIGNLVQWCLASSEKDRPSIENLYAALQDLKTKATPNRYADYVGGQDESDIEIRRIVQQLILDAN